MTTKLGIASVLAGVVLGFFAFLANFMGAATVLVGMTLSTFFEGVAQKVLGWVENDTVYNILYAFFYEWHLAWVLMGFGVVLLIIGMFIRKD